MWEHAGKKKLNTSFSEKEDSSFLAARIGKKLMFWFLRGSSGQKRISRCLPFSSGSQLPGSTHFDCLSIVCEYCCFAIYANF